MENKVITHYGVRGMRWGVRKKTSGPPSSDFIRSRQIRKKKVSELSNEEIQFLVNRIGAEKKLSELNPTRLTSAKRKITAFLSSSLGKKLVGAAVGIGIKLIKDIVETALINEIRRG